MLEGGSDQFLPKNLVQFWSSWTEKPLGPVVILGRCYNTFSAQNNSKLASSDHPHQSVVPPPQISPINSPNDPKIIPGTPQNSSISSYFSCDDIHDISLLEKDIHARFCLTYRAGFEPIPRAVDGPQPRHFINSMLFNRNLASNLHNLPHITENDSFTTDVGWGCMIRTSQLLLANAYQLLLLGREFDFALNESLDAAKVHNRLVDMFRDSLGSHFSIHNLIKVAGELPLQVQPGQWFGPSAALLSIQRLCSKWSGDSLIPKLGVVISESADLDDQRIELDLKQHPVLLLLPIRLGIDNVSPYYHSSLFGLLSMPQCVGIAGGKPSSSYYFFGFQQKSFLYLDPHYAQVSRSGDGVNGGTEQSEVDNDNNQNQSPTPNDPTSPLSALKNPDYSSFHTTRHLLLPVDQMDPLMMVGVIFSTAADYLDFKSRCSTSGNKIVHFHSQIAPKAGSDRIRKMSEFVNVSAKDTQDDVFVLVGDDQETDFVDLGFDTDSEGEMESRASQSKHVGSDGLQLSAEPLEVDALELELNLEPVEVELPNLEPIEELMEEAIEPVEVVSVDVIEPGEVESEKMGRVDVENSGF